MYLQISGEVSKKSLSAQPFKQNKKRESSQMRLKVVYGVIYCLVMCDVFTNNRRSLQNIPHRAALQNKTKNKNKKVKVLKEVKSFLCGYILSGFVLYIYK